MVEVLSIATLLAAGDASLPGCGCLQGADRARADSLLDSLYAHDCCDDTLARCLEARPRCPLVVRLAENICRRIADGQSEARIRSALKGRAQTMLAAPGTARIAIERWPVAGDPAAPVTLVEYACARCPYCAKITPAIYHAVVEGPLKGKAKLYFVPFPLRSHLLSKEGGLAFVAAATMGNMWELILETYARYDDFTPEGQIEWAVRLGMGREVFVRLIRAPATREALVRAKKEGLANGVDATPTFFIDGRRYLGELTLEELVDVVEEAYDASTGHITTRN